MPILDLLGGPRPILGLSMGAEAYSSLFRRSKPISGLSREFGSPFRAYSGGLGSCFWPIQGVRGSFWDYPGGAVAHFGFYVNCENDILLQCLNVKMLYKNHRVKLILVECGMYIFFYKWP